MDETGNTLNAPATIKLYLNQTDVVWEKLQNEGVVFSKLDYIRKKYQEAAPIFITIYSWFVGQASSIVSRPVGAEFPYWAQRELVNLDTSGSGHVFVAEVPIDEVVLFDYKEWTNILQFKYLAKDEVDERSFERELAAQGVDEYKALTTSFYPMTKQKILKSWERLFRHDAEIKAGTSHVKSVSAALWCIKKEWIVEEL